MTGKPKLYIVLLVLGLLVFIHGSSCTSGTSTTSPGKIALVSADLLQQPMQFNS